MLGMIVHPPRNFLPFSAKNCDIQVNFTYIWL